MKERLLWSGGVRKATLEVEGIELVLETSR